MLQAGEVEVAGPGIPEEEDLVLADGQDVDVAVMVDVDGKEVVGRPEDVDVRRPGSGPVKSRFGETLCGPEIGAAAVPDVDVHRGQEVRVAELVAELRMRKKSSRPSPL